MHLHPNAALTPVQRRRMCRRIDAGMTVTAAAEEFHVSTPTASKWWSRWQGGDRELHDRSSAPGSTPHRIDPEREQQVVELRETHGWGPDRLANHTGVARSTCWRIICRNGLADRRRRHRPEGTEAAVACPQVVRYERDEPGSLIHLDTKKLARIPAGGGWRKLGRQAGKANRRADPDGGGYEFVHAAVDDCSRLSYAELLPTETAVDCTAFWRRAATFFVANGLTLRQVMTDNAWAYTKAQIFADALNTTGVDKHLTIEPYRPQTNGKVERFNRTLLEEWAYAYFWESTQARHDALAPWLHWYNHHRDHTSLQRRPPMACVNNAAVCDN